MGLALFVFWWTLVGIFTVGIAMWFERKKEYNYDIGTILGVICFGGISFIILLICIISSLEYKKIRNPFYKEK